MKVRHRERKAFDLSSLRDKEGRRKRKPFFLLINLNFEMVQTHQSQQLYTKHNSNHFERNVNPLRNTMFADLFQLGEHKIWSNV